MKAKKWLAAILVLVLVLGGCAGGSTPSDSGASGADGAAPQGGSGGTVSLVWGTGNLGGTVQMVVTAISTVINNYEPDLKITVQATGGSVENPRLLRDGLIDIAHTTEAVNIVRGTGSFADDEPIELMSLVKLYGNETIFLVMADSDIDSIEDFGGKRVCVGPAGSGVSQMASAALDVAGYDLEKDMQISNLNYNDSVDALKDGSIDVLGAFTSGQMISPYLAQLDATADVRAIEIPKELADSVPEKYPDFAVTYIPAGVMGCLEEDYYTFASFSIEYADARLPEEVGYRIVKQIYENYDELVVYHATCAALTVENALVGVPKEVPVHPGLARYLQEQGLWDDSYTIGVVNG